ncbi:MAG: sensor histidine kinase [Planctomycetota bacterium]
MTKFLRTDEIKIITAAAVFIALPSLVLSVVALVVLARESRLTDERYRETHEEAMGRAVERTISVLREGEAAAEKTAARISSTEADPARVAEMISALCEPDRSFRKGYYLGPGGEVLSPEIKPDLLPPPQSWALKTPATAAELLRAAEAKEFAENNPLRASRAWRALGEHCIDLEGNLADRLKGMALFAEARCEAKAGHSRTAVRLFADVASRYASVWGEGNIPLASAAMLEKARLALGVDEETRREAFLDLASFLGRNEEVLPAHVLKFFLDEVLRGGVEGAKERFDGYRSDRKELAAMRSLFGEAFRKKVLAGGYIPSTNPKEFAFVAPVAGGEGSAYRVLLLLPNREHLFRIFATWAQALKLEPGLKLVLTTSEGKPVDPAEAAPKGFKSVGEKAFPEPLSDWRASLFVEEVGGVMSLWVLRWSLTLWVILVAAVAVVGGTVFVVRAVNREIRAAREKADFVSSVTHELKTPLTSIRMFTETLMMGRVSKDEEKQECLKVIADETDRLSRLISRMLDFSKMERGLRRFHFQHENAGDVVREAVQSFKSQMSSDANVNLQIIDPLPLLRCDRDAVVEVLLNLLVNAFKYSGSEGSNVTVRAWSAKGKVNCSVMDRGIGIPRREQKRVFQKFYRVDETLTKEVDGCGLGLAISAHIARAHGGAIHVESEPGQGSIFTLLLPEEGPKGDG